MQSEFDYVVDARKKLKQKTATEFHQILKPRNVGQIFTKNHNFRVQAGVKTKAIRVITA